MTEKMTPGRLLKSLMDQGGFSQLSLDAKMKALERDGQWEFGTVSQSTIGRIVNDAPVGNVKRATLVALAKFFDVPDINAFASNEAAEAEAIRRGLIQDDRPGPGASFLDDKAQQAELSLIAEAAKSSNGAVMLGSALAIEIDKISDPKKKEQAFLSAMLAIRRVLRPP